MGGAGVVFIVRYIYLFFFFLGAFVFAVGTLLWASQIKNNKKTSKKKDDDGPQF